MAGISSKALKPNYVENRKKYNGIEQNEDLGLNMYEAFYRNLDPQIGRFWQIDPAASILSSYSPYESMGNDPINNTDPLGDFRTRRAAFTYMKLNRGVSVGQNEFGEYYVNMTRIEKMADGNFAIVAYKYYGKGRNQYSAAFDDYDAYMKRQRSIDEMVEMGLLKRHNTQKEANQANLKAFAGVLLPNVLKYSTVVANANAASKYANTLRKMSYEEIAALARSYSKEMNAFFKSGGKEIPKKEILETYKELATRIVNKTAPAGKLTETALKVQGERLEMINKALEALK